MVNSLVRRTMGQVGPCIAHSFCRCVNSDAVLRPSLRYIRAKLRQLLALQNAAGVLPLTPENVSRIYRDDSTVL